MVLRQKGATRCDLHRMNFLSLIDTKSMMKSQISMTLGMPPENRSQMIPSDRPCCITYQSSVRELSWLDTCSPLLSIWCQFPCPGPMRRACVGGLEPGPLPCLAGLHQHGCEVAEASEQSEHSTNVSPTASVVWKQECSAPQVEEGC